ncbi:MAG: T9SS type A sorting domain-containing protein [Lacibacter sp.]
MLRLLISVTFLAFSFSLFSQSPGLIVRPAGGKGPLILNPNQDYFTSATTSGFVTSDISESEILYKVIKPLFPEPTGDLATGPSGGYSDIVKTVDNSGCYIYNDGTNILFRLRIGGIVSGAKAYNILFDTDNKIGATGPSADPNYVAPTNSGNGNPGFEWEVAMETGSSGRVAVYNVNGIINPSASPTYSLTTNTLISVALTRDGSDADYFYDFFVPLSALGITASTPIRIVVSTNTNPGSAFQGTRSDIYGINDANFPSTTDAWQYVAQNTPTFTLNDITSGGSGISSECTAAPVVNTGIAAGSNVNITGTWTRLDATKASPATIYVYKNGTLAGTTTCTSGSTWTFTIASVVTGDVITAKAQASGESMCLVSNSVAVTSCSAANTSSVSNFALTCLSNRGAGGTKIDGARVKLYTIAYNGNLTLFADDATTTYKVTYNGTSNPAGTTAWEYQHSSNGGTTDPCGGGALDMPTTNSYAFTITESGKCESAPVWSSTCLIGSVTATPTITQTVLYAGTNTISGSSTEAGNTTIRLMVNGFIVQSTNVGANGAYSFSNVVLKTGDVVTVRAQASSKCISNAATLTVTCFTSAPVITTDAQGYLVTGATTVTGTSSEAAGTTIRVYASPSTLAGTTTVQAGGTWSVSVTALVGGTGYYATAQNGSCGVSANSSTATARSATTVCPTITGTYGDAATTVSGTFPSAFTGTVYLYQDGAQIGSASVTSATTWSVTVSASNPLYAGGVLTAGAQATSSTLNKSCGTTTTVTCSAPTTPSISPASSTIAIGETVTYTLTSTESGVLYSVENSATGASLSTSQFGSGSSTSFTTSAFSTGGTYNIKITADKLSGSTCLAYTTASITVNGILPVTLTGFSGKWTNNEVILNWQTASEFNAGYFEIQRSHDSRTFETVGTLKAAGNSSIINQYKFVDHDVVGGTYYYRLNMVDNDSRSQYSNVIRLYQYGSSNIQILPNPFSTQLSVLITLEKSEDGYIRVTDQNGQIVYNNYRRLDIGKNIVLLNGLSSLSPGTYFMEVRLGNVKSIHRIVKAE